VDANGSAISALQINTSGIAASVKSVESAANDAIQGLNETVSQLAKEVSLKMDSNSVNIAIEKRVSNGVDKVVTNTTGYVFDDNGLSISKSDSEISTIITDDGMRVYKDREAVLVADNKGVKAEDLRATTYLIIGSHSRLEDYGNGRTACFWIGG